MLLPATPGFTMSGFEPVPPERIDPKVTPAPTGEVRHGTRGGRPDVRLLGGYFVFDSPDAALLVSLLPRVVHVRGVERLSMLVRLVGEESNEQRAGRDLVLTRLVEVLLIEALRSTSGDEAPPGLLRGLADARLAPAIRQMHGHLARSWTVAELAKTAALSRSAFFERFTRTVGLPPMEYLLAWRMAVAKDLLRRRDLGIAEVAERVGYGSASTFSTAFSRHVGQPPAATRAGRPEHGRGVRGTPSKKRTAPVSSSYSAPTTVSCPPEHQLLQQLTAVAQVIGRSAHVGAHGLGQHASPRRRATRCWTCGAMRSVMARMFFDSGPRPVSSALTVAVIAPQRVCPMTTTRREPNCEAANSIEPTTEGATMLPAMRTTNRSPKPWSKRISTGVRESEQPRMMAKGRWAAAASFPLRPRRGPRPRESGGCRPPAALGPARGRASGIPGGRHGVPYTTAFPRIRSAFPRIVSTTKRTTARTLSDSRDSRR